MHTLFPSDIPQSLGYLTGKTHRALRERLSEELRAVGIEISPAFVPMLGYIALNNESHVNQRDLMDILDVDRFRVSRAVKEMEANGWIQSKTNPENKRENLIFPTDLGLEIIEHLGRCAFKTTAKAFEGCTEEERRITEQTLNRILNNLNSK